MKPIEEAYAEITGSSPERSSKSRNGLPPIEEAYQAIVESRPASEQAISGAGAPKMNTQQELMFSFAAGDVGKAKYLQKIFPDSQIQQAGTNFMVDGRLVNPARPDLGDVTRSAGHFITNITSLIGRVVGASAGTAGGAVAGGVPGAIAGAVAGGAAGSGVGAAAGDAARIAIGSLLGLDQDGQDVLDSVMSEGGGHAVADLAGSAIGLGAVGVGIGAKAGVKKVSESVFRKGAANIAKKTTETAMTAGEQFAKTALTFVGGASEPQADWIIKRGPARVFAESNVDEMAEYRTVFKAMFGDPDRVLRSGVSSLDIKSTNASGLTVGQEEVLKAITSGLPQETAPIRKLLTVLGVADEDTLNFLSEYFGDKGRGVLFNPEFTGEKALVDLSEEIAGSIRSRREELGDALRTAITQGKKTGGNFDFGGLAKATDEAIAQIGLAQKVNLGPAWEPKSPLKIPGMKELMALRDELYGVVKGSGDETFGLITDLSGKPIKQPLAKQVKPLGQVPKKAAVGVYQRISNIVDNINLNDKINPDIRHAASEIKKSFNETFFNQLGVADKAEAFKAFAKLTDDIAYEGKNATRYVEGIIRNLANPDAVGAADRAYYLNALSGVGEGKGGSLFRRAKLWSSVNSVKKMSVSTAVNRMRTELFSETFLSSTKAGKPLNLAMEEISKMFERSASQGVRNRAFAETARDIYTAQTFLGKKQDLFRMGAMMSIFMLKDMLPKGGFGTLAGVGMMTALSQKRMAAALVKMQEKGIIFSGGAVKNVVRNAAGTQLRGAAKSSAKGTIVGAAKRSAQQRTMKQAFTKEAMKKKLTDKEELSRALLRSIISKKEKKD